MTRPSRKRARRRRKRRLATLVTVCLTMIVSVSWLSMNHELIIPYLISAPPQAGSLKSQVNDFRGTIYDRSYKELAESLERVSVYALPREVGVISETAARLAPLLGRSKNDLLLKLNNESLRIWLARDIDQETEDAIRKLNLPGIFLGKEITRHYPQNESFAHLLGYVDKEMGLAGIEWHYNNLLGRYGAQLDKYEVLSNDNRKMLKGKSGFHLVLTFDLKIQKVLEKYVRKLSKKRTEVQIAACVMEMTSGALIASAHYPSFKPNSFSNYEKRVLENILLQPIAVPGRFRRFFKDASLVQKQIERNGTMLPWSIVNESVDLGSQIRFWEHIALSSSLQLDFAKDDADNMKKKPFLPVVPSHNYGAVPEVATPFQLLTGISHLLNNGKKVVPFVLDRVIERESKNEYPFKRGFNGKDATNISEDFSREMRRLLDVQTRKGKLSTTFFSGKEVSYKTVAGSQHYVTHKLLFSYLPTEKSNLIYMVVVKEPANNLVTKMDSEFTNIIKELDGIVSSTVALQQVMTFNRDMMEVSDRDEMNFQLVHVDDNKDTAGQMPTRIRINSGELNMPDLVGLSLRKSLRLLKNKNVTVKIEGFGRVIGQQPDTGVSLENVSECVLILKSDYSFSGPYPQVRKL